MRKKVAARPNSRRDEVGGPLLLLFDEGACCSMTLLDGGGLSVKPSIDGLPLPAIPMPSPLLIPFCCCIFLLCIEHGCYQQWGFGYGRYRKPSARHAQMPRPICEFCGGGGRDQAEKLIPPRHRTNSSKTARRGIRYTHTRRRGAPRRTPFDLLYLEIRWK